MIIRNRKHWPTSDGSLYKLPALFDYTDGSEDEPKFVLDVAEPIATKEAKGLRFRCERHTPQTFLGEVVLPGKSYTAQHFKRWPREFPPHHRVRKQHRKTPRVKENFISMQLLTADDDRQTSWVVQFWDQDDFFLDHGMAFVESASSTKQAQKGHPLWLLDRPFTNGDEYEEALEALIFYYNGGAKSGPDVIIDPAIKTMERIYYGKIGCSVPLNPSNVLSMDYYIEEIVKPYRAYAIEKQMSSSEAEQKARALLNSLNIDLHMSEGEIANWVKEAIAKKLSWLANQDTNRHLCLFHTGVFLASLLASDWAPRFDPLLMLGDIVTAVSQNGYYEQYAHNEEEIQRVLQDAMTSQYVRPLPPPVDHDLIVMAEYMAANGHKPQMQKVLTDENAEL